ncbi:unnamed protein product [Hydatigera taeniaeformis]|uniref:Ubiquitin-like domain-containing protein n=1 Tax=Hydatigena taeniaeformis TaxID=6205 RepID=A0A0R3WTZ9_HYDTA|nr:unnamed protein product [Hydatigera taeniaeformis]
MNESPLLRKSAPSELIVFRVKYRTATKNFQMSRTTSMDDIMKRILESFQEPVTDINKFRLGLFSGDSLVDYISDSKRFLLTNDLVELVQAPELSSKDLIALLACICECLCKPERLDEVENLSERLGELLHSMTCCEFSDHFLINGGATVLFEVVTSITRCADMKADLRVQLWRHLLSGLAALINYDSLILETGRGVDIIDYSFEGKGFEWTHVPDEIIGQVESTYLQQLIIIAKQFSDFVREELCELLYKFRLVFDTSTISLPTLRIRIIQVSKLKVTHHTSVEILKEKIH